MYRAMSCCPLTGYSGLPITFENGEFRRFIFEGLTVFGGCYRSACAEFSCRPPCNYCDFLALGADDSPELSHTQAMWLWKASRCNRRAQQIWEVNTKDLAIAKPSREKERLKRSSAVTCADHNQ